MNTAVIQGFSENWIHIFSHFKGTQINTILVQRAGRNALGSSTADSTDEYFKSIRHHWGVIRKTTRKHDTLKIEHTLNSNSAQSVAYGSSLSMHDIIHACACTNTCHACMQAGMIMNTTSTGWRSGANCFTDTHTCSSCKFGNIRKSQSQLQLYMHACMHVQTCIHGIQSC